MINKDKLRCTGEYCDYYSNLYLQATMLGVALKTEKEKKEGHFLLEICQFNNKKEMGERGSTNVQ